MAILCAVSVANNKQKKLLKSLDNFVVFSIFLSFSHKQNVAVAAAVIVVVDVFVACIHIMQHLSAIPLWNFACPLSIGCQLKMTPIKILHSEEN